MDKPIIVSAYKCPYCNKISSTLTGIKLHIRTCWKKPNVKMCRLCEYLNCDEENWYCELRHKLSRVEIDCEDFSKRNEL